MLVEACLGYWWKVGFPDRLLPAFHLHGKDKSTADKDKPKKTKNERQKRQKKMGLIIGGLGIL
jgi:hypothetical protein